MSQPVTTNPVIIMLINMTVVFAVLISLSVIIRLIHLVDPTKPKNDGSEEEDAFAAAADDEPLPIIPLEDDEDALEEEGVSGEVVAVIAAALAAGGLSGRIKAVRPVPRSGWQQAGRRL